MEKGVLSRKLLEIKDNRYFIRVLPAAWLLILCIVFAALSEGRFMNPLNLRIIIDQSLIVATVATGASFIYGTGNVNIAMGATTGLIAAIAIKIYAASGSVVLMCVSAVAAGVIIGIVSVLISSRFKVRVLFVTVVMMTLLLALQQTILSNETVSIDYEITSGLREMYFPYILFVLFFAACVVIFNFTKIGRSVKFMGSNPDCSKATGIVNDRILLWAFIIAGIGAAFGALMTIVRTGSVSGNTANTLNMDVLLAIVLGGMSVFGGSRSFVYSAVLGAVTVVVLNNGLMLLGVDSIVIQGVRGIFFLVLVVATQTRTNLLPEKD